MLLMLTILGLFVLSIVLAMGVATSVLGLIFPLMRPVEARSVLSPVQVLRHQ